MKPTIACAALLALVLGTVRDGAAQQPPRWEVTAEPLLEIGVVEGDPAYQLFHAISSVRLDDGRIAVLNAGSHELRIYGADGRIVASSGREGSGPGEFARPARVYRLGEDSLLVYDAGNARLSVHTLDGTFVRSVPAPLDRGPFPLDEWLHDRSWIDGPPLGRGRGPVRAAVEALPAPDPEAGYRYVKLSPLGHLWVRGPASPDSPIDWTVYDLDARPIARVTTPATFQIHEIGRDYLLGAGRDEFDVEYIRLYGLSGAEDAPVRPIARAALDAEGIGAEGIGAGGVVVEGAGAGGGGMEAGDEAAEATSAAPEPETAAAPRMLASMRGALRMLATLEEMHYVRHRSFTTELDRLDGWAPPEDLAVRVARASPRGWTVRRDETMVHIEWPRIPARVDRAGHRRGVGTDVRHELQRARADRLAVGPGRLRVAGTRRVGRRTGAGRPCRDERGGAMDRAERHPGASMATMSRSSLPRRPDSAALSEPPTHLQGFHWRVAARTHAFDLKSPTPEGAA